MNSPFIAGFAGEPAVTLKGKAKVGFYWQAASQQIPDLHFEPVSF
jgi:hypothetical protein